MTGSKGTGSNSKEGRDSEAVEDAKAVVELEAAGDPAVVDGDPALEMTVFVDMGAVEGNILGDAAAGEREGGETPIFTFPAGGGACPLFAGDLED